MTHKIKMDLARSAIAPRINVMQDDRYSRNIQITLCANEQDFMLPEGCTALICYKKDDTGGVYDTLPDGTQAWAVQDNVVTIRVAPQVCALAGDVDLTVALMHEDVQLHCFSLCLHVQAVRPRKMETRSYVNITGFLPQLSGAQVGQYLEVAEVDAQGRATRLRPVQPPDPQTDWAAAEGESGHILNRTHYETQTTTTEPLNLTWDGNTEGLVSVMDIYYKVSDMVFTDEEIKLMTVTLNDGESLDMASDWDDVFIVSEDITFCHICIFVRKDGVDVEGIIFPESGVYLLCAEGMYVASLTTVESLERTETIVHKLDNKFIDAEWMATMGTAWAKGTVIWEEQETGSFHSNVGFLLTAGSWYVVVYDGVEYILQCKTMPGYTDAFYLGNLAVIGTEGASDTGEPFVLVNSDYEETYLLQAAYADGAGTHIVGIYEAGEVEVPNKLPEEFLPEGYQKDELVAAVIAALPSAEEVAFG